MYSSLWAFQWYIGLESRLPGSGFRGIQKSQKLFLGFLDAPKTGSRRSIPKSYTSLESPQAALHVPIIRSSGFRTYLFTVSYLYLRLGPSLVSWLIDLEITSNPNPLSALLKSFLGDRDHHQCHRWLTPHQMKLFPQWHLKHIFTRDAMKIYSRTYSSNSISSPSVSLDSPSEPLPSVPLPSSSEEESPSPRPFWPSPRAGGSSSLSWRVAG